MIQQYRDMSRRFSVGVFLFILLLFCFSVTTVALALDAVMVEGNVFHTGKVDIDLNGGRPIIEGHERLFEPGMTVEKSFYIKNDSTSSVYYKIYFDNVSGGLADVLEITVLDGESIICQGTANTLTRRNVLAAESSLAIGEQKDLTIRFHYPELSGNATQNLQLRFDLCADAVQTQNNPNKEFD